MDKPPRIKRFIQQPDRKPAWLSKFGDQSPSILLAMLKDKIPEDQVTAGALAGLVYSHLKTDEWERGEDADLIEKMDATPGKRGKADMRKAFIRRIGRKLIEEHPLAKVDIEIVPLVQERLASLAAMRLKEFAYKDSTIAKMLKGLKEGPRRR